MSTTKNVGGSNEVTPTAPVESAPAPEATKPGTTSHPWGAFLLARARCMKWLRDEMGKTPEQIWETMRMDPVQVRLILASEDDQ